VTLFEFLAITFYKGKSLPLSDLLVLNSLYYSFLIEGIDAYCLWIN